jgi:hypothetical protein
MTWFHNLLACLPTGKLMRQLFTIARWVAHEYLTAFMHGIRHRRQNGDGWLDVRAAFWHANQRIVLLGELVFVETIGVLVKERIEQNRLNRETCEAASKLYEAARSLGAVTSHWDGYSRPPAGFIPRVGDVWDCLKNFGEQLLALEDEPRGDVKGPRWGEYLLFLLLPKKDREAVLGDLEEHFGYLLRRNGRLAAKLWYWSEVLRSVLPIVGRRVEVAVRWLTLLDWWRRL